MCPSTGSSGDPQPSRRRRRGRRGSGSSASRDGRVARKPQEHTAGEATADQAGAPTPQNDQPESAGEAQQPRAAGRSRRRRPGRSGRRSNQNAKVTNGVGKGTGSRPDGNAAQNSQNSQSSQSSKTSQGSKQNFKPNSNQTPNQKNAQKPNQPSQKGSQAVARTGRSARSGRPRGKFGKPGGRRLRTVDETSAGGLVVDAGRASAALIGRLDRRGRLLWSLPKGHIESGETPEQAAIREVAEETGIAGRVLAPLGTIDYWFVAEDRRVHKTVHHFLMEAVGGELSDEDIEVTEVAWVPLGELDGRLAYADERRLVRLATDMLSESA